MKSHKALSLKKKLLLIGASIFTFSLMTSVVTTFAWYSIREISTVSHLNMVLDTDEYLKIGYMKDGEIVFDDTLENEDVEEDRIVLDQVSNMYTSTWLNDDTDMENALPSYRRGYLNPGSASSITPDAKKEAYFQNVFYLEASHAGHIYLNPESYCVTNRELNHKIAVLHNLDEDKLNEVVNATRISFFSSDGYVVCNPGENDVTYYGGIMDLDNDGYYDYDPVTGKEIVYGDILGDITYEENKYSGEQREIPTSEKTVFVANHSPEAYVASNYEARQEESYKLNELMYREDAHRYDPDYIEPTPIMQVESGVAKRIVITVYLEGWDLNMTEFICSACFDVGLFFTVLFDIV